MHSLLRAHDILLCAFSIYQSIASIHDYRNSGTLTILNAWTRLFTHFSNMEILDCKKYDMYSYSYTLLASLQQMIQKNICAI